MGLVIITALRCDQCRNEFRGYTGSYADGVRTREAARALGWATKRDRYDRLLDLCPRCLARSEELRSLPDAGIPTRL